MKFEFSGEEEEGVIDGIQESFHGEKCLESWLVSTCHIGAWNSGPLHLTSTSERIRTPRRRASRVSSRLSTIQGTFSSSYYSKKKYCMYLDYRLGEHLVRKKNKKFGWSNRTAIGYLPFQLPLPFLFQIFDPNTVP